MKKPGFSRILRRFYGVEKIDSNWSFSDFIESFSLLSVFFSLFFIFIIINFFFDLIFPCNFNSFCFRIICDSKFYTYRGIF